MADDDDQRELVRLREIDDEYRVTLAVIAVLSERLIVERGESHLIVEDGDLRNAPDLIAHYDEQRRRIQLTVSR